MAEQRSGLRVAVAALGFRDFRFFYLALLAGTLGSQIQATANLYQVYELTGSALHLGLTGLARALPILGLSLLGGVIADRVNRLHFIMLTQAATGLVALGLAVVTWMGVVNEWHIYVTIFLSGVLMAVNSPARTALIPSLVPRNHLLNAIALNSTVWQVSNIVGPAIAGLCIAYFGIAEAYALTGVTNLVTLAGLAFIQVGAIAVRTRESPLQSLLGGLRFVRLQSIILVLLAMDSAATLFGSYRALLPIFAKDILGVGPEGLGLLMSAPAVGSIVGVAVMMSLGDVRHKGIWVAGGILGYCAALFVLAASPWFVVSILAVVLLGAFDSVQMVPRNGLIQAITPDELRGRVSSFQTMLTGGMPSLGQSTSGALAQVIGAPLAIVVGAGACVAAIFGLLVARPDLRDRNVGDVPQEAPTPAPVASTR